MRCQGLLLWNDRMRDQFIKLLNEGVTIKRRLLKPGDLTFTRAVETSVTLGRVAEEAQQLDVSDHVMVPATSLRSQSKR